MAGRPIYHPSLLEYSAECVPGSNDESGTSGAGDDVRGLPPGALGKSTPAAGGALFVLPSCFSLLAGPSAPGLRSVWCKRQRDGEHLGWCWYDHDRGRTISDRVTNPNRRNLVCVGGGRCYGWNPHNFVTHMYNLFDLDARLGQDWSRQKSGRTIVMHGTGRTYRSSAEMVSSKRGDWHPWTRSSRASANTPLRARALSWLGVASTCRGHVPSNSCDTCASQQDKTDSRDPGHQPLWWYVWLLHLTVAALGAYAASEESDPACAPVQVRVVAKAPLIIRKRRTFRRRATREGSNHYLCVATNVAEYSTGRSNPTSRRSTPHPRPRKGRAKADQILRTFFLAIVLLNTAIQWAGPLVVRIGEASNPGPANTSVSHAAYTDVDVHNMLDTSQNNRSPDKGHITIITANVGALKPKAAVVADWQADILLLQETKLTAAALAEVRAIFKRRGKAIHHGTPCKPMVRKAAKVASAAKEAAQGGVAAILTGPRTATPSPTTALTQELRATARWEEIIVPTTASSIHMAAATIYGVSGAGQNPRNYKENEAILAKAVLRVIEMGDVPYVLMGDVNINPVDSEVLAGAIEAGVLVDIGLAAQQGAEPHPTYRRSGPFEGMKEEDSMTSRIDICLANRAAAAAVVEYRPRWDLTVDNHVPQEVCLALGTFQKDVVEFNGPKPIEVNDIPEVSQQVADTLFTSANAIYGHHLTDAIESRDLDAAHEYWSKMAEVYLEMQRGADPADAKGIVERKPLRTAPPKFRTRRLAAPSTEVAEPTTLRYRQLLRARNRANEAKARLQRWERNGHSHPWVSEQVTKEDRDTVTTVWAKLMATLRKVIGHSRLCDNLTHEALQGRPNLEDAENAASMVKRAMQTELEEARKRSAKDRRAFLQWDANKNHSRRAYARTRDSFKPPTHSIKDPSDSGRRTFNQQRLHQLFLDDWKKVYRKHANDPPDMKHFEEHFSCHIPHSPLPDEFLITGHDMWMQAQNMAPSGHGFDGWTVPAIKLLPPQMWDRRAEVEKLAFHLEKLPTAYQHAPNTMLPKAEGDSPLKHRGITVFSVIHRIMGGAYWHRLRDWHEKCAHQSLHGGIKGGDIMSDAWDIQADLEAAAVEGGPCVGALLDYEKFFDLFHPELAELLLSKAGIPRKLAAQLRFLYSSLHRYLKVAGTYGAVIRQENGCPQGCSFSLLVANIYVSTLFNYIQHHHPEVSLGAFIDDRNLRARSPAELQEALTRICRFDRAAGHTTNINKSAVFASDETLRQQVAKIKIGEDAPKCAIEGQMVGHTITTRRTRNVTTQLMNQRMEETIRRADKIARSDLHPKIKRKLVETAAVPSSWCGSLWNLPKVNFQAKAANSVVAALWGKRRIMRSKEIVLSILHDPSRVDLAASLAYKRLHDARRTLRRSEERLNRAIHVNELLSDRDDLPIIGPVQGLRKAARALGGEIKVSESDITISFSDGEPSIKMTTISDKLWKHQVKERIRKVIATSLAQRTVPPGSTRPEVGGRTRKDLYGITSRIDYLATTSLINGRIHALPEHLDHIHLPDDIARYHKDAKWRQRASAIIAGSVRAFDRLQAAQLCDGGHCHLCQAHKGDTEHVIWDCPIFEQTRAPFLEAIRAVVAHIEQKDPVRAQWLRDILEKPCVRNCGVIPEDPYLHSSDNTPRMDKGCWCPPEPPRPHVPEHIQRRQRYRDGKLLVYVDGSAMNPTDMRRVRAGWGIYITDDHPLNAHGHLPGSSQSSFRAELAAAIHALSVTTEPTHIVSDCRGVVDGMKSIMLGLGAPGGTDEDLWHEADRIVTSRGRGRDDITWIKAHVDIGDAQALEEAGGFLREDTVANGKVDIAAKCGAREHHVNTRHYLAADDRELLAHLVQRLQTTVWAEFYALIEDEWEQHEEVTENTTVTIPELAGTCTPADADVDDLSQSHEHQGINAEDDAERIDPCWSIAKIGKTLRQRPFGYTWRLEADETYYTIKFPEPSHPFDHTPGSHARVTGRGKIATGVDCSPILIEAIKWWMAGVRWSEHWASRPDNRRSHEYTVSYLEMVVDIEASTGISIPEKGWHQKALKLAAIMRNIARIYAVQIGSDITTWKKAMDPKPDLPPLTPLGAPRISGLSRRPRWMCSSTTEVVAANIWLSGLAATDDAAGCDDRVGRKFLNDYVISRTGVRQVIVWTTRAEKELKIYYETALKRYYTARDHWQANPTGPPPMPPSLEAMAAAKRMSDKRNTIDADEDTSSTTRASPTPPAAPPTRCSTSLTPQGRTPPQKNGDCKSNQRDLQQGTDRDTVDIQTQKCHHAPGPAQLWRAGTPTHRSRSSQPLRPPRASCTPSITSSTQGGTGASSSCGSITAPIVATSLRELRELQTAQLVSKIDSTQAQAHFGDLHDKQVKN